MNNEHTLTDEGYMENALSASITGEILTDQEKLQLSVFTKPLLICPSIANILMLPLTHMFFYRTTFSKI